jgi:predicted methyltransferase
MARDHALASNGSAGMKMIWSGLAVVAAAAFLAGCGRGEAPAGPGSAPAPSSDFIAAAVGDVSRLADARSRDALRKPAEILAFAGVKPGDTVVEIAPGGGYDTALLSRVVGPTGKVYAVDCERLFEYQPKLRESFANYAAQDPRGNVQYSSQRLDAPDLPMGVDAIWMSMFYHDTVWLGVDRAAMNRAFFEHLKPGGVYLIIDHKALSDAGEGVASELHRIDPALIRREIEAAGFTLADTSGVLANPEDPHTQSVFDDKIRGRTDRFIWKFVKPQ